MGIFLRGNTDHALSFTRLTLTITAAVFLCSCILAAERENRIGVVLEVKGKTVRISLGKEEGVTEGAVFGVYSVTKVVKLPLAGEVSMKREQEVGKIKVVAVGRHESTAEKIAFARNARVQEGMTVIQLLKKTSENEAPVIRSVKTDTLSAEGGHRINMKVLASDAEGDPFYLEWNADGGVLLFSKSMRRVNTWRAPLGKGAFTVTIKAVDAWGNSSEKSVKISSKGTDAGPRSSYSLWKRIGRGAVPAGELLFSRIKCDNKGDLYVMDAGKNGVFRHFLDVPDSVLKISRYEHDGRKMDIESPFCFDVTQNKVYVVDGNGSFIRVFKKNGDYDSTIGSGKGSGIGFLSQPVDIEVGPDGTIYIADKGNRCIEVLDSAGRSRFRAGQTGANEHEIQVPAGIEISPGGMVYVLDSGNKKVLTFTETMRYLSSFSIAPEEGTDPVDMALDGTNGIIYVLDGRSGSLCAYSTGGKPVRKTEEDAGSWRGVQKPASVCVNPFGHVYIGSGEYNELARYSASGIFIGKLGVGLLADGAAVCASRTRIFLLEDKYFRIRMFDLHGWCLDTFGGNSKKDGTIGKGVKIKADESNVYVMDTYYHNIHKYAYSGKEEAQIGDEGKEPGKFIEPSDMALDGKGSLYVLDSKLKRVSIFNPKGRFTGSFESAPDHSIQMDEPLRLTVSKDGMFVYVYDSDLYTVLKYNREGNLLSHYGQKGAKETGQFYYVDSMGVDESGCLVVAEPRYNRVQKIDFRGAAGQPMMQFHRETALAQKADLFAVHPAGILVVYSDDSSLMLFD